MLLKRRWQHLVDACMKSILDKCFVGAIKFGICNKMIKQFLILTLLRSNFIWSKSLQGRGDVTPHIVIVTPQAQVHLEPAVAASPYLQHFSPFTRYAAPHEETVVYVPTGAATSAATATGVFLPASLSASKAVPILQARQAPEQIVQAAATAQQIVNAIQSAVPQNNLSETASQLAAQAATAAQQANEAFASAGAFFPIAQSSDNPLSQASNALNQIATAIAVGSAGGGEASGSANPSVNAPPSGESDGSSSENIKKISKIQYEIPLSPLLANEPRHHYFIAPGPVPQFVDVVQTPVFVAPASAHLRARSLQASRDETPIIAIPLPEAIKPQALPLQSPAIADEKLEEQKEKIEYKRFLEAKPLQEEPLKEALIKDEKSKSSEKGKYSK
uniref:Uncharacterized protein n=1 Tax=Glossina pallidipes TaxID=7398 RepID=A0A1A9Z2S1_GLOPL